jgi:putative transposase
MQIRKFANIESVVSKDHIHIHVEYPPSFSVSEFEKKLKGRTSRLLQPKFSELVKRYLGSRFWQYDMVYGATLVSILLSMMLAIQYLFHDRFNLIEANNKQFNLFIEFNVPKYLAHLFYFVYSYVEFL